MFANEPYEEHTFPAVTQDVCGISLGPKILLFVLSICCETWTSNCEMRKGERERERKEKKLLVNILPPPPPPPPVVIVEVVVVNTTG